MQLSLFLSDRTPTARLTQAIESHSLEKARRALEDGANPNGATAQGTWGVPLSGALAHGSVDMVELLLEAGANPWGRVRAAVGTGPLLMKMLVSAPQMLPLLGEMPQVIAQFHDAQREPNSWRVPWGSSLVNELRAAAQAGQFQAALDWVDRFELAWKDHMQAIQKGEVRMMREREAAASATRPRVH